MLVTSVVSQVDGFHAKWTFNTNVTGITTGNALLVNGTPPDFDESTAGANAVIVGYSGGISPGDTWANGGGPAGITFAGGATLTPGQFGTVT